MERALLEQIILTKFIDCATSYLDYYRLERRKCITNESAASFLHRYVEINQQVDKLEVKIFELKNKRNYYRQNLKRILNG